MEFKGYRKSVLMILELINKVVHSKPSVRSVLCNRKKSSSNLSPHYLRSNKIFFKLNLGLVKTDSAFKELF